MKSTGNEITSTGNQEGAHSVAASAWGGGAAAGRNRSASGWGRSGERDKDLILIVNDLPDQSEVMGILLRKSGYNVITAENGQEGLEAALAERPDLIVSDVSMPRMDGIEMCRLIRERQELHTTPILLASAIRKDSESAVEGLRAGADDYLEVPYDPMRLVVRVARLIERKRGEERLRQSEERYRNLFENAKDIIYTQDLEGNFTSVNKMAETIAGYSREEVPGMNFSRLFSAADIEKMREMTRRKLAGETDSTSYEIAFRAKDGRAVLLEVNTTLIYEKGKPVGIQGIARDITERKRAEERLKKSEAQLAASQRVAHVGSFEWDPATNMSVLSDEFYRILGLEPQSIEVSTKLVFNYLLPTERAALRQLFGKALRNEEPFTCEHRLVRADGARRVVQFRGQKALDETGAARVIGTIQDITELKEAEEALRKSEEQFLQAQKMEAIGQLAGGVAHDFNNLLTAVTMSCDLALRKLRAEDPLRRNIEEIKKVGERAAGLTRQLLAFSRKQVLQPEVLDINAVVADMARMLPRLIGENIELKTVLDPALGNVKADPGQIEQVILNLAINARDAMPGGGKLTIETQNVNLDESYAGAHIGVTAGPHVMIAVSDQGHGMDVETLAHIFEPFFTTKELGKGTGLGLSTVYGIVKQSGGNVWVYSEVGVGSTFKIYLPRVDERAEEYRRGAEAADAPRGHETILVVEDEQMLRELTRESLEFCGYEVLVAADGRAALKLCEEHDGPIHLLLTDVVMPETSGRTLAERATRMRPEMSVLYMSGYTDDAIVHHGVLEAGTNFIQKPFTHDSLAQKVREILDAAASQAS